MGIKDVRDVKFHPGQRQLSAAALNSIVEAVLALLRASGIVPGGSPVSLVKTQAAIASEATGNVKRAFYDTGGTLQELGEAFTARNGTASGIGDATVALCIQTAGATPVLYAGGGGGGAVYVVDAVDTNYLTCHPLGGAGTIYVAKPYQNRVSGDESYAVNDEICAVSVASTGLTAGGSAITLFCVSQGRAVYV